MDYSIYTYGGGEILHGVLNGIALLFKSDNPYFTSVGTFAALIGVISAGIRAIPRASFPLVFKEWFIPTIVASTLLFGPKTSVHVIDEVDPNHKYEKIDNIPIGISAIGSLFSTISKHATETVETAFFISDANRMSKVGPMFAAQLVHQARLITITDPITRENLKDFVRQCYAWPYVFGNISPGKKAALESSNILEFIAQNPHPGLGIYWRESNGTTSFKNCTQCLPPVREALNVETQNAFITLASSLLPGQTKNEDEQASVRLKHYMGDAWQTIAKGSSSAAEVIQQELMINSYKEMLADKRDELGLGRFDSNLIHLNTMRGQASQNASFLSVTSLVGQNLPHMHASFFAIALILFALIAPWTFAMGGFQLIKIWLKVMASIALWPVLYAVLSCIGTMWAAKSGSTATLGSGSLNLITQNGLGDAAYNTYCWVMSLQAITPFLAWAVISRGEQAFSQMTSSFTQSSESFAARAGSEMVDGNVSFDTQSIGNHTVANAQIAQQQLGASMNTGMRVDDGKIAAIYGPNDQVTIQEHQTQLGTNVARNDALSIVSAFQSQKAQQSAHNYSHMAGEQTQLGSSQLFSVAQSFAENKGWTETFGSSESTHAQKSLQTALNMAKQFSKDHGISEDKAFNILFNAGVGVGGGNEGFLGKFGGIFSSNLNGQFQSSGINKEAFHQAQNSGTAKNFADSLSEGLQYLDDHKGALSKNYNTQALDQAQQYFNTAKQYSDQATASYQESENWSRMASTNRQHGITSTQNANDEVLNQMAHNHFGGNKAEAARYASEHPHEYQEEVKDFINSHSGNIPSFENVKQHHEQMLQRIENPPTSNQALETMKQQNSIKQAEENLDNFLNTYRTDNQEMMNHHKSQISSEEIQKDLVKKEQIFVEQNDEYLMTKAGRKMKNG